MLRKVTLLVPLAFNDGSPVPLDVLEGMEDKIYDAFGGCLQKLPRRNRMNKEKKLLFQAQQEAAKVETWADFSNFLFDQEEGILAKAFPKRKDHEAFIKTTEYKQIHQLLQDVRERTGLIAGSTPKKKSGRFVVRLPQSLHTALVQEADAEGVSLNQLIVAK